MKWYHNGLQNRYCRFDSYIARSEQKRKPGFKPGFSIFLFLNLLVDGLLAAPLAPLFKLDLALDELLVFGRPIVNTLAVLAGEADESVL